MRPFTALLIILIPFSLFAQGEYGTFKLVKSDSIYPILYWNTNCIGCQDTVIAVVDGKETIKIVDGEHLEPYESSRDTTQIYFTPEFIISIIRKSKFIRLQNLRDSISKNIRFENGEYVVKRILNKHIEEFDYKNFQIVEVDLEYEGRSCKMIEYDLVHKKKPLRRDKATAILTNDILFPTKKLMEYPFDEHSLPLYVERIFGQFKITRRVIELEACTRDELLLKIDSRILDFLYKP